MHNEYNKKIDENKGDKLCSHLRQQQSYSIWEWMLSKCIKMFKKLNLVRVNAGKNITWINKTLKSFSS